MDLIYLYWACLIVGAVSVVGALFGGADGGIEDATDLLDTDAEPGDAIGETSRLLSWLRHTRKLFYGAFSFGACGVLLSAFGAPFLRTLLVSLCVAAAMAYVVDWTIAWLQDNQTDSSVNALDLQGYQATVTMQCQEGSPGRAKLTVAGSVLHLYITRHKDASQQRFEVGDTVTLVAYVGGSTWAVGDPVA